VLRYSGRLNKTKISLRKSTSFNSINYSLFRTSPFLSSKKAIRSISLRHKFKSFERTNRILRYILLGFTTFSRVRQSLSVLQYSNLSYKKNKVVSSSVFTLKTRLFSKNFPISRISFRKLASSGYISGVSKSSW
jgi:ribosomal protein S14